MTERLLYECRSWKVCCERVSTGRLLWAGGVGWVGWAGVRWAGVLGGAGIATRRSLRRDA